MAEKGGGLGKFLERQGTANRGAEPTNRAAAEPEPARPPAGTRRVRRATKDGREQLLVYLRPEGIKELKLAAVEHDTTASAIVVEALNAWLQKHGRPPVA